MSNRERLNVIINIKRLKNTSKIITNDLSLPFSLTYGDESFALYACAIKVPLPN